MNDNTNLEHVNRSIPLCLVTLHVAQVSLEEILNAYKKALGSPEIDQKVNTFISTVTRGKRRLYLQRKSVQTLFQRQPSEITEIVERIPQVKNGWVNSGRPIRAITTPIAMMMDKNEKAAFVAGLLNPKEDGGNEKLDTSSADNAKKASYSCNLKMNNLRSLIQGYDEYDGGEMSLFKKLRDEILKRAHNIIANADRTRLKLALKYLQTLGMTEGEADKFDINTVDKLYPNESLKMLFLGYGSTIIGDYVSQGMTGNQRRRFFVGLALYCVLENKPRYKQPIPKGPKRSNIFNVNDESEYKWEASYFYVFDKESEADQDVYFIRAYSLPDRTEFKYLDPEEALIMMAQGKLCLRKRAESHTGDVEWDNKTFSPLKIFSFNLKTKVLSVNMVFLTEKLNELRFDPNQLAVISELIRLDESEYKSILAQKRIASVAEEPEEEPENEVPNE